jgi:hypothetical protein
MHVVVTDRDSYKVTKDTVQCHPKILFEGETFLLFLGHFGICFLLLLFSGGFFLGPRQFGCLHILWGCRPKMFYMCCDQRRRRF